MRAFIANFKRIANFRSLLTILLITLLCFFSHISDGTQNPPTLLEQTISALSGKTKFGFQRIAECYDGSYWFYIAAPVILSFNAVTDFHEEWFGGGFYLNIHRQQIEKYAVSKACVYSLHSVLCFLLGVALFMLPTMLIFPREEAEILRAFYPNGFLPMMLAKLLNSSTLAAIYPVFCIPITILIKEKFLSLSCPLLLNYMTGQISSALFVSSFTDNNPQLQKIAMLLPYMQNTQYANFEQTFGLPLFVWYIACGVVFALLVLGTILLIKRRVKRA